MGRRVRQLCQQKPLPPGIAPGSLFAPPGLLSQADDGPNSRERIFSVRRTFFGFLYRSQKPGCGFPPIRLVGVFSLATGVLLDYAKGNKHRHELRLLWKRLDLFKPGDLALADRGFCNYVLLALLPLRAVAALFRLHRRRPADLRKACVFRSYSDSDFGVIRTPIPKSIRTPISGAIRTGVSV
jgi:hypothetical protein